MKTLFIGFISLFLSLSVFSQNGAKVLGVWQAKLNGKFLTGKDLGITQAPYASQFLYYAISKNNWFLVIAPSKNSITTTNIQNLVNQQMAMEGTYSVYDNIESIPEDIRSKFEAWKPFKDKTFFVEGEINGEPQSLYFEPLTGKFLGLSKENQMEMIRVGSF